MPIRHFTSSLCCLALVGLCSMATANDSKLSPGWEENDDPEAGNTITSSQRVKDENNATGSVGRISGETKGEDNGGGFAGPIPGDWQDVYQIFIADPAIFSAGTTIQVGGIAEFDTQLWLFGPRGNALLGNYRAEDGIFGSLMGNESSDGSIFLPNFGPGIYYIAISGHPSEPLNDSEDVMFLPPQQFGDTVGPTDEGFTSSLAIWNPEATPLQFGDYEIRFPMDSVKYIPAICGTADAGSCYEANGTNGCDRLQCCTLICEQDPFWCLDVWDEQCAARAIETCVSCGNPETGRCDVANGTPYCDDASCCRVVCEEFDPTCCTDEWDINCAKAAAALCGLPCKGLCPGDLNEDGLVNGGDLGIMLARWNEVGCGDLNNDGVVNGGDLGMLLALFGPCEPCGRPDSGSCYETSEYVGCEDSACCEDVCLVDPACCDTRWDETCVNLALNLCSGCGNPANESCYVEHQTPWCNDPVCCSQVCEFSPTCCNNEWDLACVDLAKKLCTISCGHPEAGPCLVEHPSPGCDQPACCEKVCEELPRCCEVFWDADCVDLASSIPDCVPGN